MAASRLRFESQQKRSPAIPLPMPTLTKETVTEAKLKQPVRQPKGKAIDINKAGVAKGNGLAGKVVLDVNKVVWRSGRQAGLVCVDRSLN